MGKTFLELGNLRAVLLIPHRDCGLLQIWETKLVNPPQKGRASQTSDTQTDLYQLSFQTACQCQFHSVREVGAGQRGEEDLFGWLYNFRGRSSCHVIEAAYCLRATLPSGQCNRASGRHLIYKQSNLIFSVWTVCNLVRERNPSKSSVVSADSYTALRCPTPEPRCSHLRGTLPSFSS